MKYVYQNVLANRYNVAYSQMFNDVCFTALHQLGQTDHFDPVDPYIAQFTGTTLNWCDIERLVHFESF